MLKGGSKYQGSFRNKLNNWDPLFVCTALLVCVCVIFYFYIPLHTAGATAVGLQDFIPFLTIPLRNCPRSKRGPPFSFPSSCKNYKDKRKDERNMCKRQQIIHSRVGLAHSPLLSPPSLPLPPKGVAQFHPCPHPLLPRTPGLPSPRTPSPQRNPGRPGLLFYPEKALGLTGPLDASTRKPRVISFLICSRYKCAHATRSGA